MGTQHRQARFGEAGEAIVGGKGSTSRDRAAGWAEADVAGADKRRRAASGAIEMTECSCAT